MNRYSNYTPSAYTPLSLEEIAMVPAMKRKQHDELLAKQELIRSGLAKVDPLDVHFNRAVELKKGIEGKMDTMAGQLATQGVDNDMIGKTIAFNREYQDLISPTGELGQINTAKQVYAKEKENYVKDAVERSGIGRDRAEQNWAKYSNKDNYSGFSPEGKIANISPYGAPMKQDFDKDVTEAKSILGHYSNALANSGYKITTDPTSGKTMFADAKGNLTTTTNIPQVNSALAAFNKRWFDKTGEGRQWAEHAGLDLNNLSEQAQNKFMSMRIKGREDTRGWNYSMPDALNPEATESTGTIITNDSTLKSDVTGHPTYTNAHQTAAQLRAIPPAQRTPQQAAQLEDLDELRRDADTRLAKNTEYGKITSRKKEAIDLVYKLGTKYRIPRRAGVSDMDYASFVEHSLPLGASRDDVKKAVNLRVNIGKYDKDYNTMKDEAWQQSSSMRHNYSYLPSTPKEESAWNLHNENVFNTLKGIPSLGDVMDLTSIHTTGGMRKDLNPTDTQNVQDLIKSGDPKSFKINNIKTYGDNRTPEITMTFNTLKGAQEYDIAGSADWADEYGGEEKPVTVTFKMKKFSNASTTGSAPGYKNLSGAIADFWKTKGGTNEITGNFQGSEVSNSMIENAYSDIPDAQLKKMAQIDSDAREALMIRTAKYQAKKGK